MLLYDWLSDGERMFLGRIALFYLLKGQDNALLILDEPETHFNDIWKRRLVDILDGALGDLASDVIISTHSSIALTDVFAEEIGLESFALIKMAYFQQASRKEPALFDELWIYNIHNI